MTAGPPGTVGDDKPWTAGLPTPTRSLADGSLPTISAQELAAKMRQGAAAQGELLVVDVRRTDFEVSPERLVGIPASRSRSVWTMRIRRFARGWRFGRRIAESLFLVPGRIHQGCDQPPGSLVLPDSPFPPADPLPVRPPSASPPSHAALSLIWCSNRYHSVIFHCQSSSGRGPRCAGWYQDALDAAGIAQETSRAVVLSGGIKAWVKEFGQDEELTVKL